MIQENASAAVPRAATASTSPYADMTTGAIARPATKASTAMLGSDQPRSGRARPKASSTAESRSSLSGGIVTRAPATNPPTRLPAAKSERGMLPSSAPP